MSAWAIPLIVLTLQTIKLGTCSAWQVPLFTYDDSYITKQLDDRYPYLKLNNGTYIGPRDYFNFSQVLEPSRKYLEQRNLEQLLYEELRYMEIGSSIATMDQWHYSDEEIQSKLDGKADQERCLRELEHLRDEVKRADSDAAHLFGRSLSNQLTLRLLDSWGRPPSGTYFGDSYWVGSYRACKTLSRSWLRSQAGGELSGDGDYRYCWAKIRAKDWPDRDDIIPAISIRVGVCLPSSCNTKLANENKSLILDIMKFNFSPMHRARFNRIIDVYCLPQRTMNSLSPGRLIFCILLAGWLLLLASLSLIVATMGQESLPDWLLALTIQENLRRFAADDEPRAKSIKGTERTVDLRPVGIIRLLATLIVCGIHCFCTSAWISKSSSFNIIIGRDPINSLGISMFKSNDIFWVMSGLLTSYAILSRFKREHLLRPTIYVGIFLARYLRLATIQVLVLSFIKAIYLSLGEGPYWDYGTYKYSMQGQCQMSSWWRVLLIPILFSTKDNNNYVHECLPVSWSSVADLKAALLAPALVYLFTHRSTGTRWLVREIIGLISLLAHYVDLSSQQMVYFQQVYRYNPLVVANMLSLAFGETGYYNTLSRLSSLSIGMMAGIYLHERKWPWPRFMTGWYFKAILAYQLYDLFAPCLAQHRYLQYGELPAESTIKWAMLLKPRLDAVMFAIIMVRVSSDLAPQVMSHAKSFYKLSKVSYCVLLVHPMVISYLVNADESSRGNMFFSEWIRLTLSCIALSYLISFPLYILFESPLALAMMSKFRKKQTQTLELTRAEQRAKRDN